MAGFNTLSGSQRIVVELTLVGGPRYAAGMAEGTAANTRFARSVRLSEREMTAASEKAFLFRQGIFTLRRFMFYGTLAIGGMALGVARLGWQFNNTMQTARVGFTSIIGNTAAANKELKQLYVLAALTPFQFPDIVMATRRILAFNHNVGQTNLLVTGLVNALSRTGLISAQYLGRASLALGHMFAQGRLTGRILTQMAQDNIPLQEALQRQFHMTGEEIRQSVAKGMITAQQAAQALINLTQTPAYRDAAKMQATKTLVGAWSTFMDFVRMASASSQGGAFGMIQKNLQGIVLKLEPLAKGTKPLTLTMVAQAIDQQLSPKTHLIINLFEFLQGVMQGLAFSFFVLFRAVSLVLRPFDRIFNLFGGNRIAARMLGFVLGILITRWILVATWTAIAAAANVLYEITGLKAIRTSKLLTIANLRSMWTWRAATYAEIFYTLMTWRAALANMFMYVTLWRVVAAAIATRLALIGVTLAGLGWVGLALLVIYTLIVLYTRWRWFHDLVNNTAKFLWENWKWVALFLALGGGPLGWTVAVVGSLVKYWRQVWEAIKASYEWFAKYWGIAKKVAHPFIAAGRFAGHIASYALPKFHQTGGMVTGGGWSIVGERGPELLQLPGGSRISPDFNVAGVGMPAVAGGIQEGRPIVVNLVVDRKVLATAVARANQDYRSRQ